MSREPGGRIEIIDALRGLSIILMVCYHFGYDLVTAGLIPGWLLFNPLLDFLQVVFASLFIFLSGASCRFSKDNLKRGLVMLAAGAVVTAVSLLPWIDAPIWFGILHFLGAAAIIFTFCHKFIDRIPLKARLIAFPALFFAAFFLLRGRVFPVEHLWALGFPSKSFLSYDYFPLLPWVFMYLFGAAFGVPAAEGRLPCWFYSFRAPFFAGAGRRTMLIYLLHQPVAFGLTQLLIFFLAPAGT